MVTIRGRWLIGIAMVGGGYGLMAGREVAALLSLSVLVWIAIEWIIFEWRTHLLARHLHAERWIGDAHGPAGTLWLGRTFEVRARVILVGNTSLPLVAAQDRVSAALELVAGTVEAHGVLAPGVGLEIAYSVRPRTAGEVRFEGVTVRLADYQGFFYSQVFVPLPQVYRVLPHLLEADAALAQVKRYNLLPPPGQHRHPRPGIGFELLELRDYVPGDPPRSIAWKVSAKRDKLMSKDFESEVPVRCTLFVDVSNSVRVGHPGPTPLSHLVELAAGIAQTAVANRDPIGLCMFDERGGRTLSPAANQRQVIRIMNHLAAAAGTPPDPVDVPVEDLVLQAYVFSREIYPELLHPKVNRSPFRIFPLRPLRRRQRRRRVQMATLLAEYYRLDMGAPIRLLHDDAYMAEWLQRFLGEHHVAYDGPLHDPQGRYLFSSPEKVDVLARMLIRSVGKGHDNELFILMADLLELGDRLPPLLTAIKVALARHHRVMVLCPWPPGLELPKERQTSAHLFWPWQRRKVERTEATTHPSLFGGEGLGVKGPTAGELTGDSVGDMRSFVYQMDLDHHRRAFEALRSSLARLRVPVVCAAESQSANAVMAQLEQLRLARIAR